MLTRKMNSHNGQISGRLSVYRQCRGSRGVNESRMFLELNVCEEKQAGDLGVCGEKQTGDLKYYDKKKITNLNLFDKK